MAPVAILFEYAFGLRPDVPGKNLVWDVRLLDQHGVKRYPFGKNGLLELSCAKRGRPNEEPKVEIKSNVALTLELKWAGGSKTIQVRA